MTGFIDEHRDVYGIEPICKVLPIAPSTYYTHAARKADPEQRPHRAWRDDVLCEEIRRVWDANRQVYGVRKVWRQLRREGYRVARCTVERLMRRLGLHGVIRGRSIKTTVSDKATPCPQDKVNRQFRAARPNALWVSDFTYVSTWQGFAYVAYLRRNPESRTTAVQADARTGCVRSEAINTRGRPRSHRPERRIDAGFHRR